MCSFLAFAGGKKDITEKQAETLDSWQESFDITDKKPGKYNIVVTAEDQGGNQNTAGPYNVMIDPDSDLPNISITNPIMDMRIPGNLNIVGICVDDDAVGYVELILDDDKSNVIRAEGTDFWSYYLDTTNLAEGRHTIKVYGVDINGVQGHPVEVSWHLDRRQPVTEVTNYEIGSLVSAEINLKGRVSDGNGIESLAYSVDGGVTYKNLKLEIDKKTGHGFFSAPIDTFEMKDGAAVCWFKAVDKQGSTGLSSFLFFVDNTKPAVRILSPEKDESVNGIFSVAGSAVDTVGLSKLEWTLGDTSGEFEIVAGNPYWVKEFDLRNYEKKSVVFSITATDTAGNRRTEKRTISVDSAADRAVIEVLYPATSAVMDATEQELFVRGIVKDDDGVSKLYYSVDDGTESAVECDGVFCVDLKEAFAKKMSSADNKVLANGSHKITLYAEDIHGVKGVPVTINFVAKGEKPVFNSTKISSSKESKDYKPGIEVHPESGTNFVTKVTAACGITSVEWFVNGKAYGKYVPSKAETTSTISVPLNSSMPWGVATVELVAKDIYDRESKQEFLLYLTNLTKIDSSQTVVFEDSSVSKEGKIDFSKNKEVTGFFAGGNASSVELRPATKFANVSLDGNTIRLVAGEERGLSEPVKVVVTSDRGFEYESKELCFINPTDAPNLVLETSGIVEGNNPVALRGQVSSKWDVSAVYRIISVKVQTTPDGLISTAVAAPPSETKELPLSADGKFDIELPASNFGKGIHIIEVIAKNSDGTESYASQFVRNIPNLPSPSATGKKTVKAGKPIVTWVEGKDIYYTIVYQGQVSTVACTLNGGNVTNLTQEVGIISRDKLKPGVNSIVLTGKAGDSSISSKYTSNFKVQPQIEFTKIGSAAYSAGELIQVSSETVKTGMPLLSLKITSSETVKAVNYSIKPLKEIENQPGIYGGSSSQSGKATIKKTTNPSVIEADIPLQNLPVQWYGVSVSVETESGTTTENATFGSIRNKDATLINDKEEIYWLKSRDNIVSGYFNVREPIEVSVQEKTSTGTISATVDGNMVTLSSEKCGVYENISVVAKDSEGVQYVSSDISFQVNNHIPQIELTSPINNQWVQNKVKLTGTATDANGIASVELSLDGGTTWSPVTLSSTGTKENVVIDTELDFVTFNDGLITVDIKVTDSLGASYVVSKAIHKDTIAPEVQIITPAAEDVVNGETTVVFKVKDNGKLVSGAYFAPVGTQQVAAENPSAGQVAVELSSLPVATVGTVDAPMEAEMSFQFSDVIGNVQTVTQWDFVIDNQSDLPRPEIHLPEDNQIITTDFIISGVVFDDDGESKVSYRIDDGEYIQLEEYGTAYSIEIPLETMTDNEHTIYVYAEDIHGVKGEEVSRNFRVSLEEPKGAVTEPAIENTVKGSIAMKGWASDKNGISLVQVSLDNGNTYNDAVGTEEWEYSFDTRMIQDGTHVVFLRIYDNYGIEALYSSLITIDNTIPDITLELPLDDSSTSGMVFFSGQTIDNVELVDLYITIRALDPDAPALPPHLERIDLVPAQIITQAVDLSTLPDGFYNVELTGSDAGENTRRVSRNIRLDKSVAATKVNLMYPMNGEHMQGIFNVYGTVSSETPIERMLMYVDGNFCAETQLSKTNAFKFELTPELVSSGEHKITVRAVTTNQAIVESNSHYIFYEASGPWISIDNFTLLDYAVRRPYLEGRAGYVLTQSDMDTLSSKETSKAEKKLLAKKKVEKVELSFDNGKTFTKVAKDGTWSYRLENDYLDEGYHFIVARATMANGEVAITRTIIQIDKTLPYIKLISPGEGGRFNEQIEFSGLSSDDMGLSNVTFSLRSGDKSSYEVPAFIQGLYFDWHFWGATLYDVGLGLTFFDDNVKLQAQFGQFTQSQRDLFDASGLKMRYGGNVFGLKLLANIAYVPFQYFFGPDWQWLSAGFAIGANFSMFTETQSGKPQMLSAVLAQIEFPRVTLQDQKMFRTFSLYTEGQLWFLPTDVQAGETNINSLIPQISAGIRVNVF